MAQTTFRARVTGATAVVALVLLEWTTGWIGAAAWAQSWNLIRRGHFRITAWIAGALAVFVYFLNSSALGASDAGVQRTLVSVLVVLAVLYLVLQYSNTDVPATVAGTIAAGAGIGALILSGVLIAGWPDALAAASLVAGAVFLGAVVNGMMLGHWYLNQPGLKTSALARVTDLSLAASGVSLVLGIAAAPRLIDASTEGALLGLPGIGASFGTAFFVAWLVLLLFTGAVLVGARRCVNIKSIQSATGLFYVAVLSAGVAEFLLRYLMVNSA